MILVTKLASVLTGYLLPLIKMVTKFGENIGVIYIKRLMSLILLPIEYIFITYTNPNVFDFYFFIGKTVGKYVGKSVAGGRAQRDITICRTARRLQNQTIHLDQ
jgi:hypothetical protein